jgi:hypothetical protein
MIHGRTSHSLGIWGAKTAIWADPNNPKNANNNHFAADINAQSLDGKVYVDVETQRVQEIVPSHSEGGNLAYYLKTNGYTENVNMFVFNYPNEDAVIHSAKKLERYIQNLVSYIRYYGTDEMKGCIYESYEDYSKNKYSFNIVAHSLGGLVARYYIENLGHDANVDKLITICTPHWGSDMADFSNDTGAFHKLADHDLDTQSAMYGGDIDNVLSSCQGFVSECYEDQEKSYDLTDRLTNEPIRLYRFNGDLVLNI